MPSSDLRAAARDHLWLHFTRMHEYEPPVIVRGEGCYLWDDQGKRYLDALAGLFSVNIGYSHGEEIGQAALEQMRELPFYTNWSYAHPRAIELAHELARLAPPHINRAFFVSGGSEAVESAWKMARQYHMARGERRWKAVSRRTAYHGTTMGALSINGIPALRTPFEPLVPDVVHVRNTNRYHRPARGDRGRVHAASCSPTSRSRSCRPGPRRSRWSIFEPVQNAGGSFTPPAGYFQGVREICDRYGILLCADEVITGFGRTGAWFASERYDIKPDLITCAKGLSSSYAAIGAVLIADKVAEAFKSETAMYAHGITFGGHPVGCAIALKNLEIMHREKIVEHVAETQDDFRAQLETLLDLDIVGDVRGTGYLYALELVKDKQTRETFSAEESETLLRGFLSPALFEARAHLPRRRSRRSRSCRSRRRSSPGQEEIGRDRQHPRRGSRRGRKRVG